MTDFKLTRDVRAMSAFLMLLNVPSGERQQIIDSQLTNTDRGEELWSSLWNKIIMESRFHEALADFDRLLSFYGFSPHDEHLVALLTRARELFKQEYNVA
jgi:hypothetical protein